MDDAELHLSERLEQNSLIFIQIIQHIQDFGTPYCIFLHCNAPAYGDK